MIAFIKNNSLIILKKKFILLYLLNVTDIIFTLLLLQTGYFTEINLFMTGIVQSPLISLLLKVLFPAVLLYYLYQQIIDAELDQLRVANIAINISLAVYAMVNLSHLLWTAMLPLLIYFY